jgi:predicted MPP superfamily phosphohydrolase
MPEPSLDNQPKVDPLEYTLLHRLLVNTNSLQELPTAMVIAFMVFNGGVVSIDWAGRHGLAEGLLVAIVFAVTVGLDWLLLRALPRFGRSYGPDKPTAMALVTLRAILLFTFNLLYVPLWLAAVVMALISALAYYATWIEPFRLGVTHERYVTPEWGVAPPLRLLHVSDLHIERVTPREQALNALMTELRPDLIVYTGDFVNLSNTHDPDSESAIRAVISEWAAPLGVYCIPGTPLVETVERVRTFVNGLNNLKLLTNQWITVNTPSGPLNILGMVTTHDLDIDRAALKKMMLVAPKSGLSLLLAHAPDLAPEANEAGIDLYLAGHTHGGQIRLPLIGALFSSSRLGKRFIMGRYELGRTTLYTSRGVGLEGLGAPRARFSCPPEIILWEISGT